VSCSPPRPRARGVGGAFAIVSALATTGFGYIVGRIAIRRGRRSQAQN